jgi:hypothetical protein
MIGVASVFISCVLFIHMGLGDAISETLKIDFVLLRCVKCLTFWSMLAYTIVFTSITWTACIAIAFLASYAALWADLVLSKVAAIYDEKYNKILDSEGNNDKHGNLGQNTETEEKNRL